MQLIQSSNIRTLVAMRFKSRRMDGEAVSISTGVLSKRNTHEWSQLTVAEANDDDA